MVTFEPGHLHLESPALVKGDVSFTLILDYEVFQDLEQGKGMQFTLHGSIQGRDMKETFFLPKTLAYNFASNVTKILEKYGIPKTRSSIGSNHKFYDMMFADVRQQLDVTPGEPVKPEHLE